MYTYFYNMYALSGRCTVANHLMSEVDDKAFTYVPVAHLQICGYEELVGRVVDACLEVYSCAWHTSASRNTTKQT